MNKNASLVHFRGDSRIFGAIARGCNLLIGYSTNTADLSSSKKISDRWAPLLVASKIGPGIQVPSGKNSKVICPGNLDFKTLQSTYYPANL